jgi:micrococcal nuclease
MRGWRILTLLAVVATAACRAGDGDGSEGRVDPSTPDGANATVVRVVDGDTLVVDVDGAGDERVRLIGVDTPESVKPDSPVECFGHEASAFTASLLPEGTRVRLERDVEARDDYGRLLAYVHRAGDGLFVNLELVEQGYAQPLTIPPNVAYAERFVTAAREAEAADRGLWSACAG